MKCVRFNYFLKYPFSKKRHLFRPTEPQRMLSRISEIPSHRSPARDREYFRLVCSVCNVHPVVVGPVHWISSYVQLYMSHALPFWRFTVLFSSSIVVEKVWTSATLPFYDWKISYNFFFEEMHREVIFL